MDAGRRDDRRVISASGPRSSATDHERTGRTSTSSRIYVIADDSAAKLKTQSISNDEPLLAVIFEDPVATTIISDESAVVRWLLTPLEPPTISLSFNLIIVSHYHYLYCACLRNGDGYRKYEKFGGRNPHGGDNAE